jgi:methionine aminopeptidase
MKRFIVSNQTTGTTHALLETLGEAIASAIKLQDSGRKVKIIDSQGTGVIMVNHFDLRDAEAYIGHSLGSVTMQHPKPITEILEEAKHFKPDEHIYHWEIGPE